MVYVNDSSIFRNAPKSDLKGAIRDPTVEVRFFLDAADDVCRVDNSLSELPSEILVSGHTGLFGGDLSIIPKPSQPPSHFRHPNGVLVARDNNNLNGCAPYGQPYNLTALLVNRGECTFLEKLLHARAAGAAGVFVISDEDFGINPSAEEDELLLAGDLNDVAILVLTNFDGQLVNDMMDSAESDGIGKLRVTLQNRSLGEDMGSADKGDTNRVLYLNGHPLLNTKLLV